MNWDHAYEEYLSVGGQVFSELKPQILAAATEVARAIKNGCKVMLCGNGGSAADSQHFAGEMINRFLMKERRPYAAMALSTDTSVLTAIANDEGYDQVFEKQVRALGQRGDVLIGISTSGRSANVRYALEMARTKEMSTIALTGGDGGEQIGSVDHLISVSSTDSVPRIQEAHQAIIHLMCELVEEAIQ